MHISFTVDIFLVILVLHVRYKFRRILMEKKEKKKIFIISSIVLGVILLTISGILIYIKLVKGQGDENVEGNEEQISEETGILEVPEVKYPVLNIENNSTILTNDELNDAFEKYYPYYVYFLGGSNDFDRGLTWVWDNTLETWDDYTERGIDNFVSSTNSVYLGPCSYSDKEEDFERLAFGYMHETAHLFFQYEHTPISYDFGQWIWEGEALEAEALTKRALGDYGSSTTNYDITSLLGTIVNGVVQDGLKFNRSIVDGNSANALVLMSDILSTGGTNDFTSKVNALKVQKAEEKSTYTLTREDYEGILDEAAGGKTIDGVSASEWLFNQPVSDIDGELGIYLGISPSRVVDNMLSFTIYGFERVKGNSDGFNTEIGFEDVPVTVSLYNASEQLVASEVFNIEENGGKEVFLELENDTLRTDGVYKVVAETEYKGEDLSFTSFGIYTGNTISINDGICFILLNGDGTDIKTDIVKEDIDIEGGNSVDMDNIDKGYIVVNIDRGDSVTLKYGDSSFIYSKPENLRVVPVKL